MTDYELIRNALNRQKEAILSKKPLVTREILGDLLGVLEDKRILIIAGLRRVGKSTLLKEVISFLSSKNKGYCYVNFEDESFLDFEPKEFEKLNELLIEVYGSSEHYLFDEIQNIPNFESFVRRLQDEGKKIILTGSNSSLLSKEFGTKLTGRYKLFELYPFSFNEFLIKKNCRLNNNSALSADERVLLKKKFSEYLAEGGIPEYLENKDPDYIKTIYENVVYRDIISRYGIKSQKTLRELVNVLSTNISSPFTYNSLKNTLDMSNANSVKEYILYLNNSYLFFELSRFDYSIKRQLNFPRKIYIIDPAFFNVVGVTFKTNFGRIFENIVFVELKRRKGEVFYFQNKNECDFIVKQGSKIVQAIQACYQLNKENREREVKGLVEAMEEFKLKEGLILTNEQEEEFVFEGKKIKVVPAWKWMMRV